VAVVVVLCGCGSVAGRTWAESVGELGAVEGNGPKRERVTGYCILSSYFICSAQETLLELGAVEGNGPKRERVRGYCILSSYFTCTAQETLLELGAVEGNGPKRERVT
jgi:hypothetical protein